MLYKQFLILFKKEKPMSQILRQVQGESDSFNASVEIKSNRKNRRKIKKIIHNCCVYVKKADGTHEIVLKQFLVSCRLKTAKCLAKKAQEIQTQKDRQVFQELLADVKSPLPKQPTHSLQTQQNCTFDSHPNDRCVFGAQETLEPHFNQPPMFYFLPTTLSFQMI